MYIITFIEILSNGSSLLYTDECVQEACFIFYVCVAARDELSVSWESVTSTRVVCSR